MKKRTRKVVLLAVLALCVVVVVIILENNGIISILRPQPTSKSSLEIQKVPAQNDELLKNFLQGVPLTKDSSIKESYEFYDPKYSKNTDGFLVIQSNLTPQEVTKFYKNSLKFPNFNFIQGSDSNDTDQMKILVYSTKIGLLIIRIEKNGSGSLVTLRGSNIQIKLSPPK